MTTIRWAGFLGENRAIHPKQLGEGVCTVSINQKGGRGDLRPWRGPLRVASVPTGRETIYRMGRDVPSDSDYWLSWPTVVHAVRGYDTDDTTEKTYYTGDGVPKVTDNTIALATSPYPTASRPLGLPAPASAPSVTVVVNATGTGSNATFFYAYTYVNDWGWESAPSPVSTQVIRKTDDTATVGGFSAPPVGNYGINKIRVYRTQSGSSGSADFFFLREVAIGTTNTTDDNRTLAEVLPTKTWIKPPDDLSFLTSLWNGMLAGISGNGVRFSEAYIPYAWPISYDVVPPDSKPVAIGVFGQNLLVLTTNRPMLVSGSSPDSMDSQPVEMSQGCIAPRSVVSMGNGVAWASEDGLCWFGAGGPRLLTAGIMMREDWQALVPKSIIGKMYEGLYFGSYDDGTGRKGFFIDPSNPTGIYFLSTGYKAMHFDELRDQLYVLDGGDVKKWDAGDPMTVRAVSKVFRMPHVENFACAEVIADAFPVTVHFDALVGQDVAAKLVTLHPTRFTSPKSGVLRFTKQVTSAVPFRLPSGFSSQDWQIECTGTMAVQGIAISSSMMEASGT